MTLFLGLALLVQVEPFQIESKKITPEIRKEIAKLDALRVEAFEKACAALGAKPPKEHTVILRLVDATDPDPARFTKHSGRAAETSSRIEGGAEICYFTEYFVNGLLRAEETLRHEMVHAVMRMDLRAQYQLLPRWLREGIAVHVAGQTPSKLTYLFQDRDYALDPAKLIDGLEDEDHTLDDYAEDGLGVEHLVAAGGPDALIKLEAELRDEKDYRKAIGNVAGKPFATFVADAKAAAILRVEEEAKRLGGALPLYREVLEKNDKSKAECDRFLKEFPQSPLKSAVLYYRAKSAGNDGLPLFDVFIESARGPDGFAGFIDDAMLRKASLFTQKGQGREAMSVYAELVKWHVGSPSAVTALYEWGLAAKSQPLLKRALKIDPKHRLADKARKALGD